MKIHLSPRHLELSDPMEQHVIESMNALTDLDREIVSAHVILHHDDAADPGLRFGVSARLAIAGPDIHAEEKSSDLYAAINAVAGKLARQLRKRKTRLTDKRRSRVQRLSERSRVEG